MKSRRGILRAVPPRVSAGTARGGGQGRKGWRGGGQGRKCRQGEVVRAGSGGELVRAGSAGGGPIESRLSKRVIKLGGGSGVPIAPDRGGGEVGCGHMSCPPDKRRIGVPGRAWDPALGVRGTERLLLGVLS